MSYDDWKTETPEDEADRLRCLWARRLGIPMPKPECYVCGSREKLMECGDYASIEFICEDCEERDRDPEYDPMDKVERDEWERDFRDDR